MRPMTLSLKGFRSYPTPVTVDFTGKGLTAALGDTGAGKSSLLDAITFALFRKSSWDAKEPRQLIADSVDAMDVELTFLHDGHRWRVRRVMHATSSNAGRHHLTNLDTGDETDGATSVDARIKALLQMSYETFLRVGLLPQGKFDQLLTAGTRERSTRLRELFGAESLENIQKVAHRHSASIGGLLTAARAKRDAMPDDPTRTATAAGAAADVAQARAERLRTAIDAFTALQGQISAAHTAAAMTTTVAQQLDARSVPDAETVLNDLEPIATDIATRRAVLDIRAADATARERDLLAKIGQAETIGEGQNALSKAAAILDQLATLAGEHRSERDRLADHAAQLASDDKSIAAAEAKLANLAEQTQPRADAADTAAIAAATVRDRADTVRVHIDKATAAAIRLADAGRAHRVALDRLDVAHQALGPLQVAIEAAATNRESAQARLDALQLHNRAAMIAAELSPGRDCPVCRQHLPADFEPESQADAGELRSANRLLRAARDDHDAGTEALASARALVTSGETAVTEQAEQYRSARQQAQRALVAVQREFAEFATNVVAFDAETASTTMASAISALAEHADGSTPDPEQLTEPIIAALAVCERAAADHAEVLRTRIAADTARIDVERKALRERRTAHERAVRDAEAATSRHSEALARTTDTVDTLPTRIRELLPDSVIDIRAEMTAAAAAAVDARLSEVQGYLDALQVARAEVTSVLTRQNELDKESTARIDLPLNELRGALDSWAHGVRQAIAHLDEENDRPVPEAPAVSEIATIRAFASELSTTATLLGGKLTEVSHAHSARARAAAADLGEQAAALSDIDGFDPARDLTAPPALHPLVAAAATASKEAEVMRSAQREALDLIKPAADLDFAIAAGQARRDALEVLRQELVDAKFLGHLTTLNTRALLGIASETLGQLTEGRFGFAEGFDIVSRGSEVGYNASRLSGGEKFLASLALALALAELHSRSGPRLGSLFLDEGFATLDTAALEAALEALRARAGGDRFVMVISHLHAVAEAVDDVLWVQRDTNSRSTAHWLTPSEREKLVHADLISGLQALA